MKNKIMIITLICTVILMQSANADLEITGNMYLNESISISNEHLYIHDAIIDGLNNSVYIYINNASFEIINSTIKNMGVFESKKYGLSIYQSNEGYIENSRFINLYRGIHVMNCSNISISDSLFKNNRDYGINIHGNLTNNISTRNVIIKNCTSINNGHHGITFSQNVFDSKVINCFIENNLNSGLILDQNSNGNYVSNNTIKNNGDYGIAIYGSEDNIIEKNKISNNGRNSIYNRDNRFKIRPIHLMFFAIIILIYMHIIRK